MKHVPISRHANSYSVLKAMQLPVTSRLHIKTIFFFLQFTSQLLGTSPQCIIIYKTNWLARSSWKGAMPHIKAKALRQSTIQ